MDPLDKIGKAFRTAIRRRAAHPREIQIEITNRCNFACEMCPHTSGDIPPDDFPLELLNTLLHATAPIPNVVLTGWGEPLMHPQILEIIDAIHEHWPLSAIRFTTNGLLLKDEMLQSLLKRSLVGLTISMDLWPQLELKNRALFHHLHPPSQKVITNIKNLGKQRDRQSISGLRLQAVALPDIENHTRKIIGLAAETGADEVNLVRLIVEPKDKDLRPPWPQEQELLADLIHFGAEMGVKINTLNRQPLWLRTIRRNEDYCLKTDDSVYVTTSGEVTPCCNLREFALGNLNQTEGNLQTIWENPKWNNFFHNQRPVCMGCDALAHPYLDAPDSK